MRHRATIQPAFLAVTSTATAVCISVVAGWQRGGWAPERMLWVAVAVLLVMAAHMLPALCRAHGWRIRLIGAVLWIACMLATCYGHAVFFVMAQKHAAELRAAAVPVAVAKGRGLSAIAADRADVVARLARATARRCNEPCLARRVERTSLAAKLEALRAEEREAIRVEAEEDRTNADRTTAMTDPVTSALAKSGFPVAHAELLMGLAFAAVLEGVACFAWLLVLNPVLAQRPAVTPVRAGSHVQGVTEVTEGNFAAPAHPATVKQSDDVTRVMTAVDAGALRMTVTEIRKFLGCSQTTAAAVRRRVVGIVNQGGQSRQLNGIPQER